MNGFGFHPLQFSTIIKNNVTYYVDAAVSTSGDGLTWGTAFKTIAEATNKLRGKIFWGDLIVRVKAGTYNEGIILDRITAAGSLLVSACYGVVTLTGLATQAAFANLFDIMISLHGVIVNRAAITIATGGSWALTPPTNGQKATFYGVFAKDTPCIEVNSITADLSSVPAASKIGISAASCSGAFNKNNISNASIAFSLANVPHAKIWASLGSGNTTVYSLDASKVSLGTANTITGTTTIAKSNGSLVINTDGTLL